MPDYKQLRLVAKAIVVSGSAYGGSSPSSGIVSRWLVDKSIHVGHAKHLLTLNGFVAQLVELSAFNRQVTGSCPVEPTTESYQSGQLDLTVNQTSYDFGCSIHSLSNVLFS